MGRLASMLGREHDAPPAGPRVIGQRHEPPATPDGQVVGPPDFVGIGSQKAATSRWLHLIRRHPAVHVLEDTGPTAPTWFDKERHYFTPFYEQPWTPDDVATYHRWFPRPPGTITGEWTPRYVTDVWVPPLLAEAAPDAQLLLLLRDPVARFVSGMAHSRRHGDPHPNAAVEHVARGMYGSQVARWSHHVDLERLLVLQYEDTLRDPIPPLHRTWRHLGLEPVDVAPEHLAREVNAKREGTSYELPEHLRRALVEEYTDDVLRLRTLVPELDLSLWPNFAHLA